MRRSHRCAVHSIGTLEIISNDGRENFFTGTEDIGFEAAVPGGTAAREIRNAVGMGLISMSGPYSYHRFGVAGVCNAQGTETFIVVGLRLVHCSALVARSDNNDRAFRNQPVAFVTRRCPAAGVTLDVVIHRN